jgi:hypothetical protein
MSKSFATAGVLRKLQGPRILENNGSLNIKLIISRKSCNGGGAFQYQSTEYLSMLSP